MPLRGTPPNHESGMPPTTASVAGVVHIGYFFRFVIRIHQAACCSWVKRCIYGELCAVLLLLCLCWRVASRVCHLYCCLFSGKYCETCFKKSNLRGKSTPYRGLSWSFHYNNNSRTVFFGFETFSHIDLAPAIFMLAVCACSVHSLDYQQK